MMLVVDEIADFSEFDDYRFGCNGKGIRSEIDRSTRHTSDPSEHSCGRGVFEPMITVPSTVFGQVAKEKLDEK
jgi:hypothetical protein